MTEQVDIWQDRRVNIGYETAEELAKHAHPLNWRGHPEGQASATNDALDSLGWIDEIKVNINTGNVFNGHLRISLALAKDPAMRLPVDYYDLSPDEEALALQVLDATTEMAEPIPDKLASLLARTREMTADRPGLGAMLERLRLKAGMNGNGSATPEAPPMVDKAEELAKKYGTRIGQVWELGQHRLVVGDCTDRAAVEACLQGEKSEILFTSPPYSDQREYNNNSDLSIPYLAQIFEIYRPYTRYFVVNLGLKHQGDEIDTYWDEWIKCAKRQGLKLLSWNVWDKINATGVKSQMCMFALQHEWVFVFGDKPKEINRTWEKSPESQKREAYYRINERGQKVTSRRQPDGSVSDSIIGNIYEDKQLGTVFTYYAEMARNLDHRPDSRLSCHLPI